MGKMAAMRLALVANRNSGTGTDPRRIAARFATGERSVRVVVG
jgi:hypothetical protein